MSERLIKSKLRVQKHGEVFTPNWMVEIMLNNKGIKEACENLSVTFLEPAVGEGNFLIAILKRRLEMVVKNYSDTLGQFENFSLYALTTLYGIELLEDNAQMCVMNLYEVYRGVYTEIVQRFNKKVKKNVLDSAKVIIKANIAQGDFLTRKTSRNEHIIFSEWKLQNTLTSKTKIIKVSRTEYSLDEIFEGKENEVGTFVHSLVITEQLEFDLDIEVKRELKEENYKYVIGKITDVYKEEIERDDN